MNTETPPPATPVPDANVQALRAAEAAGTVMPPTLISYNKAYAVAVARCVDLFAAGIAWRQYGVTISSFCGLAMREADPPAWARSLNAMLNAIEKDHCELAIACDIKRACDALRTLGAAHYLTDAAP
jgi:hypothetical protein